jgi:NADH-quinone oxidoreductase subunit L
VLAIFSVIGGLLPGLDGLPPALQAMVTGHEGHQTTFEQFLAPSVAPHGDAGVHAAEAGALTPELELLLTGASVAMALGGVLVAAALYLAGIPDPAALARTFRPIYLLLLNKWYVDELYQALIAHPGARLAAFLAAFDLGVIDGAVNGVARLAKGTGSVLRQTQSGYVRGYAVTMLIGAFVVLAYWAFR